MIEANTPCCGLSQKKKSTKKNKKQGGDFQVGLLKIYLVFYLVNGMSAAVFLSNGFYSIATGDCTVPLQRKVYCVILYMRKRQTLGYM
ncbi:hypothetical protein LJB89_03655 [Tyzzerella sp. OttesenSCG-928-J15]|nr:hypothetical protein [Tyzzerella sp. OttesenSCG-928-J15]